MKKKPDVEKTYLRIGIAYYKIVQKPLISGDYMTILVLWSRNAIIDDYSKDALTKIPKYDGFCIIPNHLEYSAQIGEYYNKYHPVSHIPLNGDCSNTVLFLEHIFGEQIELGFDYLTILYLKPTQILPILCLISLERNTGKTMFLNWLKLIFELNMTINTNEDFRSQFNSDWMGKLLVAVDEVKLDTADDMERLKNLSTSLSYKVEAKGKDKIETDFFAKFILNANRETDFISVQKEEIRFWVRKIPIVKNLDIRLLDKMKAEIPHFLHFIKNRPLSTTAQTRMWFTPQQIYTNALGRLMKQNRPKLETDIATAIIGIMEKTEITEFEFCIKDLVSLLPKSNRNTESSVRMLVRENWKLSPAINSNSYTKYLYLSDNSIGKLVDKGRYYTVTHTFLQKHYDDLMN